MSSQTQAGLKVMLRYHELRQCIRALDIQITALLYRGAPREPTECPAVRERTGHGQCSAERTVRSFYTLMEEKTELLCEIAAIEQEIDNLPPKCARILTWRYIIGAKRTPIANRLGISLRHYSRLKERALCLLGEQHETIKNAQIW